MCLFELEGLSSPLPSSRLNQVYRRLSYELLGHKRLARLSDSTGAACGFGATANGDHSTAAAEAARRSMHSMKRREKRRKQKE